MIRPRRLFLAAGVLAASTIAVPAGEFCVTCSGPDLVYRCTFAGQAGQAGVQLTCIGEIARIGGHKSCAIARNHQGPCEGKEYVVAAPLQAEPAPSAKAASDTPDDKETFEPALPADKPAPPPADHADDSVPPPASKPVKPEKPPRTVKELVEKSTDGASKSIEGAGEAVGDAAKSAGSAVEKTGSAIGNAAKKTWKCITSLFGDC